MPKVTQVIVDVQRAPDETAVQALLTFGAMNDPKTGQILVTQTLEFFDNSPSIQINSVYEHTQTAVTAVLKSITQQIETARQNAIKQQQEDAELRRQRQLEAQQQALEGVKKIKTADENSPQ